MDADVGVGVGVRVGVCVAVAVAVEVAVAVAVGVGVAVAVAVAVAVGVAVGVGTSEVTSAPTSSMRDLLHSSSEWLIGALISSTTFNPIPFANALCCPTKPSNGPGNSWAKPAHTMGGSAHFVPATRMKFVPVGRSQVANEVNKGLSGTSCLKFTEFSVSFRLPLGSPSQ